MKKPYVLYQDLDDTIFTYNQDLWTGDGGLPIYEFNAIVAAPGAKEYFEWASEHFEIRWLTGRCPRGILHADLAEQMSKAIGLPAEFFSSIHGNPWFGSNDEKCAGIDFTDPRPWVWVEDGLVTKELSLLNQKGLLHCWYPCDVTRNPHALEQIHALLRKFVADQERNAA